MSGQRSYFICYDIADAKRLRKIEKIMEGYGYRLQESVFFCRLSKLMEAKLRQNVLDVINHEQDQWMSLDLGDNPEILNKVVQIGKKMPKIPKMTFI